MNNKWKLFKEEAFARNRLRNLFLYSTLVNLLLSGVFLFANPTFTVLGVLKNVALHTYFISYNIHFLVSWHNTYCKKLERSLKVVSLIVTVYFAVLLGYILALTTLSLWSLHSLEIENVIRGAVFSFFISTIFVICFYAYEFQRTRLEKAVSTIKEKEINEHLLKKLKVQAELQALQATINPHFLFNTLNSIASLIALDPDQAELAVEKLSRLFRATLRNSTNQKMTLGESLELVESYLELEKIRLGSRLEYSIELEPGTEEVVVHDLLIQPLVENSIKHGISPLVQGGKIWIEILNAKANIRIRVRDNGVGWDDKATENGHGLLNIRRRLELVYENKYQMNLYKDNGVIVEIIIPRDL